MVRAYVRVCGDRTGGDDLMNIVPITLKQARGFVDAYHRHNAAPQGHKFSIGLEKDGELIGVAIVGRPVARFADDGRTAEVTRVCVTEGNRNANSMLYGAACRACRAMGYDSVITYTLNEESGASLKAAGFTAEAAVADHAGGWDTPSRRRIDREIYHRPKQRWRKRLNV